MPRGDRLELVLGDVPTTERLREILDVADHRCREVEVQLAARNVPCSEGVPRAERDEDERAGPADGLATFDPHDVFALEDVERLRTVVVDVDGRAEAGRLGRLEDRRLLVVRLDRDREAAP